ncbi:unnamed protein product, partial [Meganyctiphanes norvegica]
GMRLQQLLRVFKCTLAGVLFTGVLMILDQHACHPLIRDIKISSDDSGSVSPTFPSIKIPTIKISTDVGVSNISKDYIDLPTFSRDITPSTIENIFLLETSNSSKSTYLKYRTLCSVERWFCQILILLYTNGNMNELLHELGVSQYFLQVVALNQKTAIVRFFGLFKIGIIPKSLWIIHELLNISNLSQNLKLIGMINWLRTVKVIKVSPLQKIIDFKDPSGFPISFQGLKVVFFQKRRYFSKTSLFFKKTSLFFGGTRSTQNKNILKGSTHLAFSTVTVLLPNCKIKLFYGVIWITFHPIVGPKVAQLRLKINYKRHRNGATNYVQTLILANDSKDDQTSSNILKYEQMIFKKHIYR